MANDFYDFQIRYYPKEKAFLLLQWINKGTKKDDSGKDVRQLESKVLFDSRSDALKKEEEGDWIGGEYLYNDIDFNIRSGTDQQKAIRSMILLIFKRSEKLIFQDPGP